MANRAAYQESDDELRALVHRAFNPLSVVHLDYLGVDLNEARAVAKELTRETGVSENTALTHAALRQLGISIEVSE